VATRVASNNGEEQSGSLVRLACGLLLKASNSNDRRPRHNVERLAAADGAGLKPQLRDEPSHLVPDFIRPPVVLELLGAHSFARLQGVSRKQHEQGERAAFCRAGQALEANYVAFRGARVRGRTGSAGRTTELC
jgi:hypothetical protein